MKITSLLLTAFVLACASCDKHSWDSTKGLHEGMHKAHGSDHGGDAHAKPADGHAAPAAEHKEPAKH